MARSKTTHKRWPAKRPGSSGSRVWQNFALKVASSAAQQAIGSAIKYMTTTKEEGKGVDFVTNQMDHTRIPLKRRRRVSKKFIRRKRRFTRAVRKVIEGPTMRVLNKTGWVYGSVTDAMLSTQRTGNVQEGEVGMQSVLNIPIFSYATNNNDQDQDDINEMLTICSGNQNDTTNEKLSVPIYVKSALWEIMITNSDTVACYVDIYHWKAKRDCIEAVDQLIFNADNNIREGGVPTAGTNYLPDAKPSDYGWTPYQCPGFMRVCRIFRKERFLLPAGQTVQLEKRIKAGRIWKKQQLASYGLSGASQIMNKMKGGLTEGILLITYGVPSLETLYRITGPHAINVSYNKSIYFDKGNQSNYVDTHWRTTIPTA